MEAAVAPFVPGSAVAGVCGSSSWGSIMRLGIVSGRFSWHAPPARQTIKTKINESSHA